MEQGTIVYLCESLFGKFRELFDWMKSDNNWLRKDVKSKSIENKFVLIYSFENTAVISVFDDVFDQDLGRGIPSGEIEQFTISNQYVSPEHATITEYHLSMLLKVKSNLMKFTPVKRKCFIFEVPLDKLTKIEKL